LFVTVTEFKAKFGKYAELAQKQEIHVTKRGKEIFCTAPPKQKSRAELVDALFGVLPLNEKTEHLTLDEIRAERLKRYEYPD